MSRFVTLSRFLYYLSPVGRISLVAHELSQRQRETGQTLRPEAWCRLALQALIHGRKAIPSRFAAADTCEKRGRTRPPSPLQAASVAGTAAVLHSAEALAAQNPAAIETAATFIPGLPPGWQMAAGAILYAEPAIRLSSRALRAALEMGKKNHAPQAETKKDSFLSRLNRATGTYESLVGPWRDFWIIVNSLFLPLSMVSGKPLTSFIPAFIALGLSLFSYRDRKHRVEDGLMKRQLENNQVLRPEAFRRHKRESLGILGNNLPARFSDEDVLGNQPPRYADGVIPKLSRWPNILGLFQILRWIPLAFGRHMRVEGTGKTLKGYFETLFLNKEVPLSEKFRPEANLIVQLYSMDYARVNKATVVTHHPDTEETIPSGSLVMEIQVPHTALYPDFAAPWLEDPNIRYAADKINFHDNLFFRLIGLSWLLTALGIPMVEREPDGWLHKLLSRLPWRKKKASNKKLLSLSTTAVTNMEKGNIPSIFPQAGRVPEAFNEDGTPDQPGLYSNPVDKKNPEYYVKRGAFVIPTQIAQATGRNVYIRLRTIKGSSNVDPPAGKKKAPFTGPNKTGQTVTTGIVRVIEVKKGKGSLPLQRQVMEEFKKALGINELLQKRVTEWASELGNSTAAENFTRLAASDERYYIIADRIRSIHPKLPERKIAKAGLIKLCESEKPIEGTVKELLNFVTEIVRKTKHKKEPWKKS